MNNCLLKGVPPKKFSHYVIYYQTYKMQAPNRIYAIKQYTFFYIHIFIGNFLQHASKQLLQTATSLRESFFTTKERCIEFFAQNSMQRQKYRQPTALYFRKNSNAAAR